MIYPYMPIEVFVPNWIEKNLTSTLVLDWRSALVSFFVKKEFSTQEAVLVGSGFLYLLDGKVPCIMTASHVITEMRKSDYLLSQLMVLNSRSKIWKSFLIMNKIMQ